MNLSLVKENPRPIGEVLAAHPLLNRYSAQSAGRWSKTGLKRRGRPPVVLETIRIGRSLCTTAAALDRFLERLNAEPAEEMAA